MENVKDISIPMSSSYKFYQDLKDKVVDPKLYKNMIRSLLYLTISSPKIIFSIYMCAHY